MWDATFRMTPSPRNHKECSEATSFRMAHRRGTRCRIPCNGSPSLRRDRCLHGWGIDLAPSPFPQHTCVPPGIWVIPGQSPIALDIRGSCARYSRPAAGDPRARRRSAPPTGSWDDWGRDRRAAPKSKFLSPHLIVAAKNYIRTRLYNSWRTYATVVERRTLAGPNVLAVRGPDRREFTASLETPSCRVTEKK